VDRSGQWGMARLWLPQGAKATMRQWRHSPKTVARSGECRATSVAQLLVGSETRHEARMVQHALDST
jgi:hypothetical protein